MKAHYTLHVDLTLLGPVLTAGAESAGPGMDISMAQDRKGRWMLPFSLIKGRILDALSELQPLMFQTDDQTGRRQPVSNELQKWLGRASRHGTYDPERGSLIFGDFTTEKKGNPDRVRIRNAIDQDTGSARKQHLLMIQSPFHHGEEVPFNGSIDFLATEEEAERICETIELALRHVASFGSNRTIGDGRTKCVQVVCSPAESRSFGTPAIAEQLPFELRFDRPFCFPGIRRIANHFESEECIGGADLKGAIARMLQEAGDLSQGDRDVSKNLSDDCYPVLRKHFSRLRISVARPRRKDAKQRPVQLPLSLVRLPKHKNDMPLFYDEALEEVPRLIHGEAPAYQPDWKQADFQAVRRHFGWETLNRERRIRTAVDPQSGQSEDGMLFSYGMVQPDWIDANGCHHCFLWDGRIGLEEIPEDDWGNVRAELMRLLKHGITGLGKTRAIAALHWKEHELPPAVETSTTNQQDQHIVIVTLQSDCLMTNPDTLQREAGTDNLFESYQEFWSELSEGKLKLLRFFAQQTAYGGFVARRSRSERYEPFLLTDRGSVFVLELSKDESAAGQEMLQTWERQGLPNARWIFQRYSPDEQGQPNNSELWRHCRYLRENGYGEIAINLACHWNSEGSQPSLTGTTP